VSSELRASLSHLTPAKMRERAVDYLLMAEAADTEQTKATFLRVAARLQELAREATVTAAPERHKKWPVPPSPAVPAMPPGAA
jgi:hypothetical protein